MSALGRLYFFLLCSVPSHITQLWMQAAFGLYLLFYLPDNGPQGCRLCCICPVSRAKCGWCPQNAPHSKCAANLHLTSGREPSVQLLPRSKGRLQTRQGQVSTPSPQRSLDVEWSPGQASGWHSHCFYERSHLPETNCHRAEAELTGFNTVN